MKSPIFYFRGLNTYNDDNVHIGRLTFGSMYKSILPEFSSRQAVFVPVTPIGFASLEEMAERAKQIILNNPVFQKSEMAHFLGHSTGGLLARMVAHDSKIISKVLSLTTVGTPHKGSETAEKVLIKSKFLEKLTKPFGWSIEERQKILYQLSPNGLIGFDKNFPQNSNTQYASIITHMKKSQRCPPLKAVSHLLSLSEESDGLVTKNSQKFGEVLDELQLDHVGQIGYFPYFRKKQQNRYRAEFVKMIEIIIAHCEQVEEKHGC